MATAVGLNMKITADTAGIGRGVSKTEQQLGKLSKSAASAASSLRALVSIEVATRLASAFTDVARSAINMAARVTESVAAIDDLSQRTGLGVESLQSLQLAADLAGVQNLEGALQKVSVVLGDAAAGSESARKAFSNVGLSVDSLLKLSPDEQFKAVAKAIGSIKGPAAQAAAAVDLFGKSGVELLPLFASNLEEIEHRAKQLGMVLSGNQVSAITEMDDALLMVRKTFDGIIGQVTANLAPVVTSLANEFLAFVEAFDGVNGATGGTGIADAITSGLLDFTQYLAEVFDSVIVEFNNFGAVMSAVGGAFSFVGNIFAGAVDAMRMIFAEFQLAINIFKSAAGLLVEGIGKLKFDQSLAEFGKEMRMTAIQASAVNIAAIKEAGDSALGRYAAAFTGGDVLQGDGQGPLSRAVQAARDRLGASGGSAASAAAASGMAPQIASAASKTMEAIANKQKAVVSKAMEDEKKLFEERTKNWLKINEEIAQVEMDRAKQSEEIERDRLESLSRQSNQALSVSDIRSGGISEILRIATGREDPAVEEYRKQLGELRKIDAKLGELRAERVQILGLGARAA